MIPEHWLPFGNAEIATYGPVGDYVGGVWGTVLSGLALVIIFFTWRLSKKSDVRNATISVVAEMLKTHDAIAASFPSLSSQVLREFAHVYRLTQHLEPDYAVWSERDRADIAYTYVFFGPSLEALNALSDYNQTTMKRVHDAIARIKNKGGKKFSGWFVGHQTSLSHYMRNLFSMYDFIDRSALPLQTKMDLGKIIRTKLSNYDQAVLAVNILSHFGREWESEGLVARYKPFSNVPKYFFGYDARLSLKSLFPFVRFEWERTSDRRLTYYHISLGGLRAIWWRELHEPLS